MAGLLPMFQTETAWNTFPDTSKDCAVCKWLLILG
jgi:hypothetical protein